MTSNTTNVRHFHLPFSALESKLISQFCEDENGDIVNRINGNGYNNHVNRINGVLYEFDNNGNRISNGGYYHRNNVNPTHTRTHSGTNSGTHSGTYTHTGTHSGTHTGTHSGTHTVSVSHGGGRGDSLPVPVTPGVRVFY